MRVGEPIIDDEKNFFGVIISKFTFKAAKKINHFVFKRVRYTLYNHAINEIAQHFSDNKEKAPTW